MLSLAQQLASLLDETRFEEAAALLAEDCRYHYWEGNYAGRNNVINIYKQNHTHSSELFDEVRYGSIVEPLDGGRFQINFFDNLRLSERWHEMKCYDILQFRDGLISDIEHHDIPGEQEAFMAFWRSNRPAAV